MQSVTQGTIHCGGKQTEKGTKIKVWETRRKKGIIPFLVSSGFNDFSLLIESSAGPLSWEDEETSDVEMQRDHWILCQGCAKGEINVTLEKSSGLF
ncbi:hypothetical protein CDAR_69511 [Caerostris darwini]|uniref:Uncharacterized protein n=1 Tax=Caerostris darwini TaxID=1538125 RepID=A0AAV4U0S3_9ARAC|nr:hypothetical protein CDAR_69511 [Caerostris darwini]